MDRYPLQLAGVTFGLRGTASEADPSGLVHPDTELRFAVPKNNASGLAWVSPEFDDRHWRRGQGGIGYDAGDARYGDWIKTDLRREMPGRSTAVYLRIPFLVTNLVRMPNLELRARYDDGFIAWLNGREVARQNAPQNVSWNSVATSTRPDEQAREPERIILEGAGALLVQGTNWLAVQVLNSSLSSSDLLFCALLMSPGLQRPLPASVTSSVCYLVKPTPGRPNAVAVSSGPRIEWLSREPATAPQAGEPIVVTAKVGPLESPVSEVKLSFRVMFDVEREITMSDDGRNGDGMASDGTYGASIPPQIAKPGQMIRYCVIAKDTAGRTSRWPLFADSPNYSAYEGTIVADPALQTRLPVVHLFTGSDSPSSRRARGGKFALFYNGELYDNVTLTPHGQISRGFPKQSFNVSFPRDHEFRYRAKEARVQRVDLLANFADKSKIRSTLAYEMIAASGSIGHFAFPIRLQRNGEFYSVAELIENGDGQWLRRVGRDSEGALYKMNNNLTSVHGAEKKSRPDQDHRDLAGLIQALVENRPLEARAAYAYDHIDIPQCISYFVAMALISSDDHGHKNYYLYHVARLSGEWALFPWDVDLSWGRNWTGQYFNETVFVDNPLDLYRNGRSKPRNRLYNLFFEHPDFRQMYLRRLRTVMDELLQAPGTPSNSSIIERRIRELMDELDPPTCEPSDAELDATAWPSWGRATSARAEAQSIGREYLPGRRQFLFTSPRAKVGGEAVPPSQPADVTLAFTPLTGPVPATFISVTNSNKFAVDISGWQVRGAGIQHRFRPGTVIPEAKSIYVVANVAEFRRHPPAVAGGPPFFIQGNWRGHLQTNRSPLELVDVRGRLVATGLGR